MGVLNKRLTGLCATLVLLTLSAAVYADTSAWCDYELLTGPYEYLVACGVKISPERYERYERLRAALKDFINLNSVPGKPRIDLAYEESRREEARVEAEMEKCRGPSRQFSEQLFEAWMTQQAETKLLEEISYPRDPQKGDCLLMGRRYT